MKFNKIIFLLLILSTIAHADEVLTTQQKIASCSACHGLDGNSPNPIWPKIAGQHPNYFIKQMIDFKKGNNGGRYDPSMTPLMASLNEQDFEDIAAFYAVQNIKYGQAKADLVKRGEELYRGGDFKKQISACIACHGPAGRGNDDAAFPALAGQYAQYSVKQLQDYKNGTRNVDLNQIMQDIAKHLDLNDMQAVASYIEGLH